MSTSGLTAEEVTESLTGWDEIAVAKHFDGFDLYMSGEAKPMLLLRALAFVHLRRAEAGTDAAAHKAAMDLTVADLYDYFEQDDEANPEDPDTDSGKDDSTPAVEPSVSPLSASPPESHLASTGT